MHLTMPIAHPYLFAVLIFALASLASSFPEPYPYKSTTTTTTMTTPAPYEQYQKREAKPEPYQHKPTTTTTTTPAPYKRHKRNACQCPSSKPTSGEYAIFQAPSSDMLLWQSQGVPCHHRFPLYWPLERGGVVMSSESWVQLDRHFYCALGLYGEHQWDRDFSSGRAPHRAAHWWWNTVSQFSMPYPLSLDRGTYGPIVIIFDLNWSTCEVTSDDVNIHIYMDTYTYM